MKLVVRDCVDLILHRSAASSVFSKCFHCSHETTVLELLKMLVYV